MKKLYIFLLLLLTFVPLQAQEDSLVLLNNCWAFGMGEIKLFDSYLSPLQYKGKNYQLDATHSAFYKRTDNKVSWANHNHIGYAKAYNPAYSSSMDYLELSLGYGSYYHFTPIKNLILQAGGNLNLEGGIKYLSRNVNNIASADLAMTMYLGGSARYYLEFRKFTLGFQYQISTPVLGVMFVPQMGQSYYELYLNLPKGLSEITHFSSFHNKLGVKSNFGIDLMFTGFTLRLGMNQDYQQWKANYLYFYKNQFGGYIAMVIDLHLFSGMKSKKSNSINYY